MTFLNTRLASALRAGALAAAVAPLALAPAAGFAQSQSGQGQAQTPAQEQAPAPSSFSDEQLQAFADAMVDVRDIMNEAAPQMESAQDDAARREVRKAAAEEMIQAVQDSGLSVETYNDIARSARENPDLARKITGYVEGADSEG